MDDGSRADTREGRCSSVCVPVSVIPGTVWVDASVVGVLRVGTSSFGTRLTAHCVPNWSDRRTDCHLRRVATIALK